MDNANIQSKIKELKTYIKESLKEYPNFIGVDVHNLAPSEEDSLWIIQGKNKQVQGYYYGEFIQFKESKLISIKAIQSIANKFILDWKKLDNQKAINKYKYFLKQGQDYGWD